MRHRPLSLSVGGTGVGGMGVGGTGVGGRGVGGTGVGGTGVGGTGVGGAGVGGAGVGGMGVGGTGVGGAIVMDAGATDSGPVDAAPATLTQIWTNILGNNAAAPAPGCLGCHNGNVNIPNYTSIATTFATLVGPAGTGVASTSCPPGLRVVPGNADASVLINKLRSGSGFGLAAVCGGTPMPRGNRVITLDQLHMIESWITAGALNN